MGFLGRSILFVAMTVSPFWCRALLGLSSVPLPFDSVLVRSLSSQNPLSSVALRSFMCWLYSQHSPHQISWFSLSHYYQYYHILSLINPTEGASFQHRKDNWDFRCSPK